MRATAERTSVILLCLIVGVAPATPQQMIPPSSDKPSVSSLTSQADLAFTDWVSFGKDTFANLFTRPPNDVIAELDSAEKLMHAYKSTQISLYDAIDGSIVRDIAALRNRSKADWPAIARASSDYLGLQISALRQQELGLIASIERLKGKTDPGSIRYRIQLEGYLQALQGVKVSLTDERTEYDRLRNDNSKDIADSAVRTLEAKRTEVKQWRASASLFDTNMTAVYSQLKAAVLVNAPGRATPPVAQQGNPAVKAPPVPPGAHRVWSWREPKNGAVGSASSPVRVEFAVSGWGEPNSPGSLKVWFTDRSKKAPDRDLQCLCELANHHMTCTVQSSDWVQGLVSAVSTDSMMPLGPVPPLRLKISAQATPSGGAFPAWVLGAVDLRETAGPELVKPAAGKQDTK